MQRADGQVAGAEVGARRAAREAVGEQRAHLGERERRVAVAPARRLGDDLVEQALQLGALPGVARRGRGQRVGGVGDRARPTPSIGCRRASASSAPAEPVDQLGEAAGEVDRAAVDVVERQHARRTAAGRPRSSSRRAAAGPGPARQVPVGQRVELERRAVRGVEAPADAASRDPVLRAARGRRRRAGSGAAPARGRRGRAPARRSAAARRARAARATTPSTGLVWRSERSASRTRRSSGRRRRPASRRPSSASPAPNVAWISGANVSMSGHITITSRGSSVGSSASRCRIASRSTSTWRARPWQAWTWTLRSSGSSSGRSSARRAAARRAAAVGADVGLEPAEQRVGAGERRGVVVVGVLGRRAERRAASRARRGPRRRAGGCAASSAVGSSARRSDRRRVGRGRATRSHSAGDGCSRNRWTSRCAASARRTCRWPAGSRVRPNSDSRAREVDAAPGRRAAARRRGSRRSAGPGTPIRARSRRHSSACQAASARRSPASGRRRGPGASISGPVQRVAVEQAGEVADALSRRARRTGSGGVVPSPRWAASVASHGSPSAPSTTSSSGQTARSGSHGSSRRVDARRRPRPRRRPAGAGTGTRRSRRSRRRGPDGAPSTADSRWVSQRSMPRVGTATTSGANGSAGRLGEQRRRARRRGRRRGRLGGCGARLT